MFCGCPTTFGAAPNTQTCPVCLGMPGALPVINRGRSSSACAPGSRSAARINAASRFARKHYFYPDMPKNYQITQYDEPLAEDGALDDRRRGDGTRAHRHPAPAPRGGRRQADPRGRLETAAASLVDFNRAGVPLMEIVSRAGPARAGGGGGVPARAARVLVYLGVCDGNMEEGSLRCDANVSLRPRGRSRARHEGRDQEPELVPLRPARARVRDRAAGAACSTRGERIVQETRLWDRRPRRARVSMRTKEVAHDYRYFPEPDLPPLVHRHAAGSRRSARRCPSSRRPRRAALRRGSTGSRLRRRRPDPEPRRSPTTSRQAARAHGTPKAVVNWVLTELLRELPGDDERAVGRARAARPPGGTPPPDRRRHHQRQDRQGRVREDVPLGAGRRRHRAPRGTRPRWPTRGSSPRVVDQVLAAQPEGRRRLGGRQEGGRSASWWAR